MSQLRAWLKVSRTLQYIFLAAFPTVLATCDLVSPAGVVTGQIAVDYPNSDSTLVSYRLFTPRITVTQGGVPVEDAPVQFVSSNPDVIEVQGRTLKPKLRGFAWVKVRLIGSTLGQDPPLDSIQIRVIAARVQAQLTTITLRSLTDTATLVAQALTDSSNALVNTPIRWRSTNPAVATIDSITGHLRVVSNSSTLAIAEVDGLADTVTVGVGQVLARYVFSPPDVDFRSLNDTLTLIITPLDSGGTPVIPSLAPPRALLSRSPGVTVSSGGRLTSIANGNTYVLARNVSGTVVDSIQVRVAQFTQDVAIFGADTVAIEALGETLTLTATAKDSLNNSVVNTEPEWTSLNEAIATVDQDGLVTGQAVGVTRIRAGKDAGADTVTVRVTNFARELRVTPDTLRMTAVGDGAQLTATPLNRLGTELSQIPVTWRSLDTTVATVSATGAVTAVRVGSGLIIEATATSGSLFLADTTSVDIIDAPETVSITAADTTLASINDSMVPAVNFRNSRNAPLGRTSVVWSSVNPNIASVSNDGFIRALGPGQTFVKAVSPYNAARRDSLLVTVTNAPVSLTLNRVLDTLTSPTKTLQYSADIKNAANGLITGLTVTWSSTNTAVASISASGLVTAGGIGTTLIIAQVTGAAGPRADTSTLVALNVPATLTLNPLTTTLSAVGGTQQLIATARNDLGNIIPGLTFGWGTSNGGVASVSLIGLVTAQGPGTAVITATIPALSVTLSATADVSVVNPPDLVDITPTNATLGSVNDSVTPAVVFETVLGDPLPREAATWSSDDPAIASVTSGGIIIAQARGVTKVRATNPLNANRRDSITVTVTNATVSVELNRTSNTLTALNRTLDYAAIPRNARGNVVPSEPMTWTSLTPIVASVSNGLATALTVGTTQIVASVGPLGSVGDTANLAVTNLAATVELTPSPVFINTVGSQIQLVATARNDLGAIIGSPFIVWGTGNTAIAIVDGSGLLTGAGIGSTTATATVDGVIAVITVNVANDITLVDILTPDTTLVSAGDTVTLAKDFQNSSGTQLPRDVAQWQSSDPNIATVSGTGVVVAQRRGSARIKAVSPDNIGIADSMTITVADSVDAVTLSRPDTTLTSVGRTLTYAAAAFNRNGGVIQNQAITFVSRTPSVATINGTGLLTAVGTGTSEIVALAQNEGDSSTVTVTNNAVSVEMTPARDTILDLGGTLQLTAIARNDLGGVVPGAVLTWTALQPTIAGVSASGLVTASAVNTGIDSIIVQAPGGIRDTSVILVANAPRTIAITSGAVTLASFGDQQTLAANIRNLGNVVLPRNVVTWTSSAPTVVAVNDTGRVTALARGVATITATSPHDPTLTSSESVTVTNAPVSVVLNADTVRLSAVGRTFGLNAIPRNAAGNPITDTAVTWSGGAASVAVTPAGVVTAVSVDTTFVTATVNGTSVDTTATIIVTNLPVSVSAALSAVSLGSLQDTLYLRASARNDLGAVIPAISARWTSSNTAVVGLGPNPGTAGAFTQADSVRIRAIGVGQATVRARIATGAGTDSVDVSMTVTVRDDPTTVIITPAADTLRNLLRTAQPAVDFRNSLNAALPRTAALWTSVNPSVATVSSNGTVTAVGPGTARIAATSPSNVAVTDTVTYVVHAPARTNTLDHTSETLTAIGRTLAVNATVRDTLGNLATDSVRWTLSAGGVVSLSNTNGPTTVVTALAVGGPVTLTSRAWTRFGTEPTDTITATVALSVTNDPASIERAPSAVSVSAVRDSALLTATPRNNLGAAVAGRTLTWSTSNAGVVRFIAASPDTTSSTAPSVARDTMRIRAMGTGTATVTVTTGGVSSNILVTVRDDPTTVEITPANVTIGNLLRTDTPAVNFRNGLDSVLPRTAVAWSTTNPSVATVTAGGVVTGVGAGTAMIAATSPVDPSATDTVTYTVNAPAFSVELDRTGDSLTAVGRTAVFLATARDSLGNALAPSATTINWSATNNAGPRVTFTPATGTATTVTAAAVTGATPVTLTATVTSALGTFTDDALIGVGNDAASINVTPSAVAIDAINDTLHLSAVVRNNLGVAIPGASVTWTTSNAGVVLFQTTPVSTSAGPLVTTDTVRVRGAGGGSATVTATSGSVSTIVLAHVTRVASGATSTIAALLTSITANGVATSTITVQLRDEGGSVLTTGGDDVVLAIQAPALGTTIGPVFDNDNGTYTATLTAGVTPGTVTVTGTVNTLPITDNATVDLVAGPATLLVVTGSATQTAGDAQTVTITARDAQGNTAASYAGAVSLTFSGALSAPSGTNPTASNNVAADVNFGAATLVTFTAGVGTSSVRLYRVETALVAVTDGTISAAGANRLSVGVTVAVVNNFAFGLATPQVNNVAFTGTNTLTARDLYHNVVTAFDASADAVTVSANAPLSGVVSGLGSGGNAVLNQAGDFVSGVASLTGDLAYTGLAQTGTFTATAGVTGSAGTSNAVVIGGGVATQLAITGPAAWSAGTRQAVTITARDASGNTAPAYAGNQVLTFSGAADAISGDSPTVEDLNDVDVEFGDPATITFTGGVATRDMRLVLAESALINVSDGTLNATGNELSVTVSAGALDEFVFVLSSPQVINEPFTGTNTLTARDEFHNIVTTFDASADNVTIDADAPLSGGSVEGLGSGGDGVLDQAGDFTNGVADLTGVILYRGLIGTGTFTATSASAQSGQSGGVTFTPGEAVQAQILGSATQTAGTSQLITIRAFDAGNNTATGYVGDHVLTFSGAADSPTGQSATVEDLNDLEVDFGDPTTITFTAGVATRLMRLYAAGNALVTASDGTIDAVDNELSVTVTAADASIAQSTVAASPLTDVLADGVDASTVTVQLRDAFGNNTATGAGTGVDATLTGTATNAAVGAFGTLGGGTYTASLTSTTFGDAVVNARINTTDITHGSNPPTVTFVASRLVLTGAGAQTAATLQTVTITAMDADGNTVTSYTGDQVLTFGGASDALTGQDPTATDNVAAAQAFGTATTVTFAAGIASTDITLYRAEATLIDATDQTISAAGGDRLSVTLTEDVLDNFGWSLSSPQGNTVAFTGTNTLTARDQFNNTVTTFDASTDNVTVSVAPSGAVTGLGLLGIDVLDQAGDFVSGVANLTGTLTYTGAEPSVTFTATSAVGAKAGTSAAVTITP